MDQAGATPAPAPSAAPRTVAAGQDLYRQGGARPPPLVDLSGSLASAAEEAPPPSDPFAGAVGDPVPPELSGRPELERLGESVKQAVIDRVSAHAAGSPDRATLVSAVLSPAFSALDENSQRRMIHFTGGTNPLSSAPRAALQTLLDSADFQGLPADGQADRLRRFVTEQPQLTGLVASLPVDAEPSREPYQIRGPTEVTNTFVSGSAQALRYDVEIAGQTIPLFYSKGYEPADGVMHSLEEVVKGLAALPDSSRRLIRQVNVDGKRNPADAYWEKVYNTPGFRSYMTAGAAGVVDIYPTVHRQTQASCDASLIHETGHILSGQKWGNWQSSAQWADWDAAVRSDGLAPSGYAKNSKTEDFSESLTLYQLFASTPSGAEFRAMFPERYRIIDELLAGTR